MTDHNDYEAADAAWATHPVDSTYHHCCHSIDSHAPMCPIERGPAVVFAEREREQASVEVGEYDSHHERPLYGHRHPVGDTIVRATALQDTRGQLVRGTAGVQVLGDAELSAVQARQLAAALLDAADQAEHWERSAAKHRHPAGRAQLTLI